MGRIARYQPYKACSPIPDSRQSLDKGNDDDDDITYIGTNKRRTHVINGDANPRPQLNPLSIAPAPPISSYLRRHSPSSSSSPSSQSEFAPSVSSCMSPPMSHHGPVALPTLPIFNLMPSPYNSSTSSNKKLAPSLPRPKSHASLTTTSPRLVVSKAKSHVPIKPRPSPAGSHTLESTQGSPTRRPAPASLSPVTKFQTIAPRPPRHHHRGSGSSGGSMASMSSVMSRFTVSSTSDEDTYQPWTSSKETAPRAMQGPRPSWNASGYQYPAPR
ncbi:hypothetical protein FRB96_001149 [Tulasnella sp. 330]|nr:hypothetical protein FRB96_001149 [Tulasnella sp. 330]